MHSMMIRDVEDLERLLVQLQQARSDHQWVEAKRARSSLPQELWRTLSAFANSDDGGLLLLGVDESANFAVTGVEDAGRLSTALAGLCQRMDPPLFPPIATVAHPDGIVVAATIAPVPSNGRPCHLPDQGPAHTSSFIRVGDSNARLDETAVTEMLTSRIRQDHSWRPAPGAARLDPGAVADLLARLRDRLPADRHGTDDELLRRYRIVGEDGAPTLVGLLTVGDHPEDVTPVARVACRRAARSSDPVGTRMKATHLEGTIGQLADDTLRWLAQELGVVQVVRDDGQVVDAPDVPAEVLREMISNALLHRSFSDAMLSAQIVAELNDDVVVVTSPGGLAHGVSLGELGRTPASLPRNYALVRVCEALTSPSGARLIESQASGIPAMDRACARAGLGPVLFAVEHATRFVAIAPRGVLDLPGVRKRWPGLEDLDDDAVRLVAVAERLRLLRERDAASVAGRIELDLTLAVRTMGHGTVEAAAVLLDRLRKAGALRPELRPDRTVWVPEPPVRKEDEIPAPSGELAPIKGVSQRRLAGVWRLLEEVAAASELRPSDADVGVALRARKSYFAAALDSGLIEPTTDVVHDPTRAYRLTAAGQAALERRE